MSKRMLFHFLSILFCFLLVPITRAQNSRSSTNFIGGDLINPTGANCTGGFLVTYQGGYFATTAGHCKNQWMAYQGNNFIAPAKFLRVDNGVTPDAIDLQLRQTDQLSLRPIVRAGGGLTKYVDGLYNNLWVGLEVCKFGYNTRYSCGEILALKQQLKIDLNGDNFFDEQTETSPPTYVIASVNSDGGDSGGPVFVDTDGLFAAGWIVGGKGLNTSAFTPVSEVAKYGINVVTKSNERTNYVYQDIYTGSGCSRYRAEISKSSEQVLWGTNYSVGCQSAPGTAADGAIANYTAFVTGNKLWEAIWREGSLGTIPPVPAKGWVRTTPLNSEQKPNYDDPTSVWNLCCSQSTAVAAATGSYVLKNELVQNVFSASGSCTQYRRPLDPSTGMPNWNVQTTYKCSTSLPGSGTVQTYDSYVLGGRLHEAHWRGGYGYTRYPHHRSSWS